MQFKHNTYDRMTQTNNGFYNLKYETLFLLLLGNVGVGWRDDFLLLTLLRRNIRFHFCHFFDLFRQRSILVNVIGVISTNNNRIEVLMYNGE